MRTTNIRPSVTAKFTRNTPVQKPSSLAKR